MRNQELHPLTVVINKTQRNQAKKSRNEALSWLIATFPQAFDNSLSIQPLKLGIMDDILMHADKAADAGISKSKLREAVVLFTRRIDYLTCLKARNMRIDLEGNVVMPVTEEDAARAALKIKKRVEKSAKNARKILAGKSTSAVVSRPMSQSSQSATFSSMQDLPPHHYPERAVQNSSVPTARTTPVTIKHKSSRQYDPDMVARLKEKLGLSRKIEENKEVSE